MVLENFTPAVKDKDGKVIGGQVKGKLRVTRSVGGQQELRVVPITLDSYDLLNLRLGVEYKQVTLSLFSNNVTNEIYRVARDTTIARYNQPRTSGIEATFRW